MVEDNSRANQGEFKEMTPRERSNANLKPQRSGEPGHNPAGRPKKENCLTSVLKSELCKIPEQLPNSKPNTDKLTWAQILGAQAIKHAAKGNSPYYKEILDRVEGKVPTDVNVNSDSFRLILGVKGNNGGNDQTDQP